jgi:hypothetical protein
VAEFYFDVIEKSSLLQTQLFLAYNFPFLLNDNAKEKVLTRGERENLPWNQNTLGTLNF